MGLVLLGCSKSIDIEYGQPTQQTDNSLIGVWDGTMSCSGCVDNIYRYKLTIERHENNTASGKLRIYRIPNQQYYILFDVSINIDNNSLKINTTRVIEELNENSSNFWCKENVYQLDLSADRTKLSGKWISSGNCTNIANGPNDIELTKQ